MYGTPMLNATRTEYSKDERIGDELWCQGEEATNEKFELWKHHSTKDDESSVAESWKCQVRGNESETSLRLERREMKHKDSKN